MITTERNTFIGVHTEREIKERLREEANARQMSLSRFIHELFVKALKELDPLKRVA